MASSTQMEFMRGRNMHRASREQPKHSDMQHNDAKETLHALSSFHMCMHVQDHGEHAQRH